MHKIWLLIALTLAPCYCAQAWSLFGPRTYEDCVLDGLKGGVDNYETRLLLQKTCREKFKKEPTIGETHFSYLGGENANVRVFTNGIDILESKLRRERTRAYELSNEPAKVEDVMTLVIKNKNQINEDLHVSFLDVSFLIDKSKSSSCSDDENSYIDTVTCWNRHDEKTYECRMPPKKNRGAFCFTGFILEHPIKKPWVLFLFKHRLGIK